MELVSFTLRCAIDSGLKHPPALALTTFSIPPSMARPSRTTPTDCYCKANILRSLSSPGMLVRILFPWHDD